ncbi:MAG: PLP-dependent aminotransferase family protein [Oryzomonas sp.]|uniref:MocR-like pyridoxine biosynthesis transcription factor PdxR n=1 Tax=Oryzomonas sp. TaxID=2855186 RepID=UPI002850D8B6|nr:PLP-dependent aminotransferase family protein [Oryzomonas sp.]MDR3578799.1 PLP-dependent aminotransferase family protein [Oryzomonas sp.]
MFILNNSESVPLYKQLYNKIRERILSGQLSADTRLPSVRVLANELSISRNTVEGAYQELCSEGYIYSRSKSGYYVSAHCHDSIPFSPNLASYLQKHPQESPSGYKYDFHPARLDPESFPAVLWRKCFNRIILENPHAYSVYSDPQGEHELRCNIQSYLESSRGVLCQPEQIVICAGLQQGLDIVAHLLKKNHSSVAVEDPGYHLPRSVFRNHAYGIVPIPVRHNGIDIETLKSSQSTIVYVTPSHQLPLGYVMPVAHRLSLIEWAEAGGKYILEDDYDSELRYHGKPFPSLQGLRPGGNIIYLGTFSKVLSPALRISYLVLPKALITDYKNMFKDYFSTISLFEQLTLSKFMSLGHWERHIRRMRTIYKKKHDTLVSCIETHFGSRAEIIGRGAGLHVVVQLQKTKMSEAELIGQADKYRVRLFPFSVTRILDEPRPLQIMLGFGGMSLAEIEQGVSILSRVCPPD